MFNLKSKKYAPGDKVLSIFYLVFSVVMMSISIYWFVDGWGVSTIVDYAFYVACMIVSIYIGVLAVVALLGFTFERPSR